MTGLYEELKRRNVFRATIAYVVIAWLILQVTDVITDILQLPAWLGQLILLVLIVGLPITLIISWLYELTPQGLQRDGSGSQQLPRFTARTLDRLIISILAIAVAFLVASNYLLPRITNDVDTATVKSVAVLPFVNMSSDVENEYFSDGLSEELLNVLAQVKNFRVPGRTSSFAFKGRNEDLRQIGELLDVDHILEGSIRQQGEMIRITAQLNNVETGYHVWSATYDRKLTDVFDIQDEIATEVVSALKKSLLSEDQVVIAQRATENLEAYRRFMRGMHFRGLRTLEGYEQALYEFQAATVLDPMYATAFAGLSMAYRYLSRRRPADRDELISLAQSALDRATELDTDDSWVQFAIGSMSNNREDGVIAFERAIELNPSNADAYIAVANNLRFVQDAHRILELHRQAYEIDPMYPTAVDQYAIRLANVGEWDKAWQLLDDFLDFNPGWVGIYMTRARMNYHSGKIDAAVAELHKALELDPNAVWAMEWLSSLSMTWGDLSSAQDYIQKARETAKTAEVGAIHQAAIYARQGDPGKGYSYLSETGDVDRGGVLIALAQLSILSGDKISAQKHIESYTDKFPDSEFTPYLMVVASILYRCGRIEEAREYAAYIIAEHNLAEANGLRHHLWPHGRAAMRVLLGDHTSALEDLRTAVKLGYVGMPIPEVGPPIPEIDLFYGNLAADEKFQTIIFNLQKRLAAARERYAASTQAI